MFFIDLLKNNFRAATTGSPNQCFVKLAWMSGFALVFFKSGGLI